MEMKLDDLLKLALNLKKNPEKLLQVKRVIYLKTNFYGDDNSKLTGVSLFLHKRKIRKKYYKTEFREFIEFQKKSYKKLAIFISSFIIVSTVTFFNSEIKNNFNSIFSETHLSIEKEQKENIDMELTKNLFLAKYKLGVFYLQNRDFVNSYLSFVEAQQLSEKLDNSYDSKKVENKILEVEKKAFSFLENEIETLRNNLSKVELEQIHTLLKIAKNFNLNDFQGELYEIQGDFFSLKNESKFLEIAINSYTLAQKFYQNKDLDYIDKKIYNLKILIKIDTLIKESKILKLTDETNMYKKKRNEALILFNLLDTDYQSTELKNELLK